MFTISPNNFYSYDNVKYKQHDTTTEAICVNYSLDLLCISWPRNTVFR